VYDYTHTDSLNQKTGINIITMHHEQAAALLLKDMQGYGLLGLVLCHL
jgi:hypothetical protein